MPTTIDLDDVGLDEGGHIIVERALGALAPGQTVAVSGSNRQLMLHLGAWCRAQGHRLLTGDGDGRLPDRSGRVLVVQKGAATDQRWQGPSERARRNEQASTPTVDGVWLPAEHSLSRAGPRWMSPGWIGT